MTLVEMLTAMMVSVLLIGTAFSTFWAATQAWDKAKRRSEMIRLTEGTVQIITSYLRAIQPPFLQLNPAFFAINDGDEESDYDSVCFLSSANPRFPRELDKSDLCEVEFYIDTGAETEETAQPTAEMTGEAAKQPLASASASGANTAKGGLWMRIDPTPDDDIETGGYLVELGEQITSLNFRFFDGMEWLEDWYDETQVPIAVEFTLTVSELQGRENPMTLTRLVTIPMAKAINEGAFASSGQSTMTQSSGSGTSGASPSGTSSGGSSGSTPSGGSGGQGSSGGTQSTARSGGSSGR
jgi:hypothetical protein